MTAASLLYSLIFKILKTFYNSDYYYHYYHSVQFTGLLIYIKMALLPTVCIAIFISPLLYLSAGARNLKNLKYIHKNLIIKVVGVVEK